MLRKALGLLVSLLLLSFTAHVCASAEALPVGVPVITSPCAAHLFTSVPFTYQITATNSPTSFDAVGLPTGLTVDTSTGIISGSRGFAGSWSVTISATNGSGTGTQNISLVNDTSPSAPVILG